MKMRLSVVLPQGGTHDVALSCDVTTTVGDIARCLIRAGFSPDPRLADFAARRLMPVTLRASRGPQGRVVLLDPMAPVTAAGLQSGLVVQPVPEFDAPGEAERLIEATGFVDVLSGEQRGARYSLLAGDNLIGRDRSSRVQLLDQSVSRKHALLRVEADGNLTVTDLGSANGIALGDDYRETLSITRPTELRLGSIEIRLTPGPAPQPRPLLSHRIMHTRSPRVALHFPASERELPTPPAPATPARIPVLAMFAPMLMGGAMYAITQSPMSLIMVAFTPMMMIGSWVDSKLGGRRKHRKDGRRFAEQLAAEHAEIALLRTQEIAVRATETPSFDEVRGAIERLDELLWTRRPEHRSFLELRFGEGVLPSRTALTLPPRGETPREQWARLQLIAEEFEHVSPVPVIERFERCGSIGVVGAPIWAEGAATSLVLQLVGLHSPHEVVLACFAGPRHEEAWSWLKWLPHVDPVASPIPAWQLADSQQSSLRLLTALEGLLETRKAQRGGRADIRSHLGADTRNDEAQGDAVRELPTVPAVIVLVLEDGLVDTARLIELAETGPDHGVHVIWVSRSRAALPAACRTFMEIDEGSGHVHFVRTATSVPLTRHEHADSALAHHLARRLAPVEDTAARVLDESDLPKSVPLHELHRTDLLGGAAPIAQAWAHSGSLTSLWQLGQDRDPVSLSAVVGQGPDATTAVDLRTHGPHALVGGTTGAGKSEFLQTWIMSMAADVSPDRLTFLLVDYKGGAAFAECVDLPHTVGLVTDLSPHLVRRALTSLRAELHYREELLAAHGAKDLISMERRSDAAAPPVLVIVIDEFAALAGEVPEFVDGVIDIAQRGRSLGLHLVMATQRPAGVIKDTLRANTNLRIALRMSDEPDSTDIIGAADAAFFDAETPGRGAIKVGPGRIAHFQTGYLGGRVGAETPAGIELCSLGFTEGEAWNIPPEASAETRRRSQVRDIEQLRDGIVGAAHRLGLASPRRPWLDELPTCLTLAELRGTSESQHRTARARSRPSAGAGQGSRPHAGGRGPVVGLLDDPAAQAQRPVRIDFEDAGSISIIGAGGTGKTGALIAIAAALSDECTSEPVQIYAIDAAGGALDTISTLPTVGAVAPLGDAELTGRVLRHLSDVVAERGPRYAAVRAGGLSAYRDAMPEAGEPRVVLLLDGFAAFRQATETLGGADNPFAMLTEIMMQGRSVGVHVVLTADRPSVIPATLSASLQRQFVLRLANPHDYAALGVRSDVLEGTAPGRALLAGDEREMQFAVLGGPDLARQSAGIEALAAELTARGVERAPRIVNAPDRLSLDALSPLAGGLPSYGIDTRSLDPVGMPLRGLGVIAGPSGAGLSQAALCCVAAMERTVAHQGHAVDTVLLSFAETGLAQLRAWGRVARGDEEVADLAEALTLALGGRTAPRGIAGAGLIGAGPIGGPIGVMIGGGPGTGNGGSPGGIPVETGTPPPLAFPAPGARGIVVVERPAEAAGTPALPQLVALAKAARRARVLVLFEFESGTASETWDLYQSLKQPSWGLSLQPDQNETQSPFREDLGRVKRADFPPGRGFAIENGRAVPVQVALPSPVDGPGPLQ
ncbi:FtsK/SpoIIIE domain-containing protein [Leucobacter ruminantium]|uniref:FHA domain-containing protein n=1 Tax=Leucobacter ruminantium TaxID=1289170 RepID=A0A939LZW5_9MICO|nr:FtsK/SpoIIIE domain-containing protein [Leucobacter ruminantium]MBO1805502.1 FHA domain-containing protein [Leucobacter ruminantium]